MSGVLTKITRGRQPRPLFMLVHGVDGVGKTTFAAGSDDPLFFDCENRTDHVDLARFKPADWDEVLAGLTEVYKTKPCATLVLDTIDAIESMIWQAIMKREGASSMERAHGGYGKAYKVARDEFLKMLVGLEKIRSTGINIIMLAHSDTRMVNNPEGENYDRWSIRLHEGKDSATSTRALVRDRVDLIGFACFETFAKSSEQKGARAKAFTTGERVLRFVHNPAYESKRGIEAPDECALNWAELSKALSAPNV